MTELTEQFFWDRVCRVTGKENFLKQLSVDQPTLIPCEFCSWPSTIHINGETCTRTGTLEKCPPLIYENITRILQDEMFQRNQKMSSSQLNSEDFKSFLKEQQSQQNLFFERLWKKTPEDESKTRNSKLIKTSKPPLWTKEMTVDIFKLQVLRWSNKEKEIPETERYHELLESLKVNKEIRGLTKYVNDEVTEKCDSDAKQKVSIILDSLERKYGRTELEKMEDIWSDLSAFKVNSGDDGEEVVESLRKVADNLITKVDIKNNYPKFIGAWMLQTLQNGKFLSDYESQRLREELKNNDEKTVDRFLKKLSDL